MTKDPLESIRCIWNIKLTVVIIPSKEILQVSPERKESTTGLFVCVGISSVCEECLFFQIVFPSFVVLFKLISECLFVSSCEEMSQLFQFSVCLSLWFLCCSSQHNSYLMKLTHLSGYSFKSSEKTSSTITDNSLHIPPSFLYLFHRFLVLISMFILYHYRTEYFFFQR